MELIPIEGTHPFVDETFYLNANPDVQAAVNAGVFRSGLEHFILEGANAGLQPVAGIDIAYFLTSNSDNYMGDRRAEFILGLESSDRILGLDGNDRIHGNQDNDTVNGNIGDDTVYGGKGDDLIYGGQNNDQLFGDLGDDTVWGDRGNDTVFGGDGGDYLSGLFGNDSLEGNTGQDTLDGNEGEDTLDGGDDDDLLNGGNDSDRLFGNTGNDTLLGDNGADTLTGGDGQDFFAIGLGTGGSEIVDADVIADFIKNEDTIELLDGLTFEELNIFAGTGNNAGHTIIQHQSSGEYLAIVNGINPGQLDENDFIPKTLDPPITFDEPDIFVCDAISGTCYFVAPNGSDTGAGNAREPFKSIQKAAEVAQPGDKVYIRGGTYRETVKPANSGTPDRPITFAAFNNEDVIISGTEEIDGWTRHSGNIFKVQMSEELGKGNNQIFVDGEMMAAARWPNIPVNPATIARDDNAIASAGTVNNSGQGIYTDDRLNFADNFWQGAKINFLGGWNWTPKTGTIVSNSGNEITFDFPWNGQEQYRPQAENAYYLWDSLKALDTAKEWYYDETTDTLYLWSPNGDNPSNYTVEAKQREFAVEILQKSDIYLENIQVFGSAIKVFDSDRITLDGITSEYGGHAQLFDDPNQIWESAPPSITVTHSNNVDLKNSHIAYTAGVAVNLFEGSNHKVTNSTIHDLGYAGTNSAAVSISSPFGEITKNTFFNSGSRLINVDTQNGIISNNELFNGGLQASDFGAIIAFDTDGQGTDISENVVHHMQAPFDRELNYFGSAGILLEEAKNFEIQRNLVYETSIEGIKLFEVATNSPDAESINIANNTVDGEVLIRKKQGNLAGTVVKDNILSQFSENNIIDDRIVVDNNVEFANLDDLFRDRANRDYQLKDGSAIIGTGAFELGQDPWFAGATVLDTDLSALQIQFNEPVNGTLSGQITGLPIGRKLPEDFQVMIGDADPSGSFQSSHFDPITGLSTVTFTNVAIADRTGMQSIYVRVGENEPIELEQMIDLGELEPV